MGMLHDQLSATGVQFIGYWPNDDSYQFQASKALTADKEFFVGLALDEDSQYELSDARIQQWCEQIMLEYAQLL